MAKDVKSAAAKEGYQAFIDANDQLEGLVVLQYSPYAGGKGDIIWLKNKQGYEIPVISIRYTLWNFGNVNHEREGTPAYIAQKLTADSENKFSVIGVHAWSKFRNIGKGTDPITENTDGDLDGASAAKLMRNHLGIDFETVNVQELIWRIRMSHNKEETERYLKSYY